MRWKENISEDRKRVLRLWLHLCLVGQIAGALAEVMERLVIYNFRIPGITQIIKH